MWETGRNQFSLSDKDTDVGHRMAIQMSHKSREKSDKFRQGTLLILLFLSFDSEIHLKRGKKKYKHFCKMTIENYQ